MVWYGTVWYNTVASTCDTTMPYLLFSYIDPILTQPPTSIPTQPPTPTGVPCGSTTCKHYSTCEIVQGVPKCVCPNLCPDDPLQMCGSDGITYDNECALRRTSCLAGRIISLVRIGVCRKFNILFLSACNVFFTNLTTADL